MSRQRLFSLTCRRFPGNPRPRGGGSVHTGEADGPAVDWQPTGERFRDPRTKRIMRVWVDAGGGRHYVPDQPD